MAVPQRLNRKLQQVMGPEAAEDLVNLLDGVEVQRSELRAFQESMRAEFSAMRAEFAEFRQQMRGEFAEFRDQMRGASARTQAELVQMRVLIAETKADLMKWMLVFWVGAVGAIAALAGVLR